VLVVFVLEKSSSLGAGDRDIVLCHAEGPPKVLSMA
jgi:hypothetical protein